MNYTKGSWRTDGKTLNFTGTLVRGITCEGKNLARTVASDQEVTVKENDANAHLITAAPEMYEALQDMKRIWSKHFQDDDERERVLKRTIQALAKAEGKEAR